MHFRSAILALGLASAPMLSQAPNQLYTATQQQLDVTKILLGQEAAWNHGDLDAFFAYYKDSPDTEVVLGGPVRGLANIRSAFRINYPNRDAMGQLENSEVEVRALGETFALATGKYHLTRTKKAGGDADGSFAIVMEKVAGGWRIIFSEST